MGIAGAIIGAGVIGAVGSGVAGSMAADAQIEAADKATALQLGIYNSNKAMLSPWNDAGFKSYQTLNNLLGVGGNSATMQSTLESLPGYQFTLGQGLKSVQNSAAARGLGSSGAALKGAASYATGLANNTFGSYADRLSNSAQQGLSAANAIAGVGTQTGQMVGSNMIGAGNAAAASLNNIGNNISNLAGNVGQYYTLKGILGGGI